jgi:Cys/Met metabolism PLP-dependent enzyme
MTSCEGKFAPGSIVYFALKESGGSENEAAERFIDYIANHAYTITLAVSLGQIKTLIENPFSMTHAALPPELKRAKGIEPGGVRLSVGLEDWHDIIEDLRSAYASSLNERGEAPLDGLYSLTERQHPIDNFHLTGFGMELARWTLEGCLARPRDAPARGNRGFVRHPIPTVSSVGPAIEGSVSLDRKSATIILRRHHGTCDIALLL